MFRCNMRENNERVVTVPDYSKAAFLHLLRYLYMDDFFTIRLYVLVELWVLADMYLLKGLADALLGDHRRCVRRVILQGYIKKN